MQFRPLWSLPLQAGACGLALARERGTVFAWDRDHWFYVLDSGGQRQTQRRLPGAPCAGCCAEDGSAYAAAAADGQVWWLAPDLQTRWETKLPYPALAVALDPFGQYLAAADARGGLHLFDCLGRPITRAESPRPLHHLAFVPAAPLLVGSADYGLAAAFDLAGQLLWRVGLVSHVGGLAASGDGALIALACFSEGLQCYDGTGKPRGRIPVPEPCRQVALAFDGRLVLVGGLAGGLWLLDGQGRVLGYHALEKPAALALGALGADAVAAVADGPVIRLSLEGGPEGRDGTRRKK
jgi:hypothetical protein